MSPDPRGELKARVATLLKQSLGRGVRCSEGHGEGKGMGRLNCPFCVDALAEGVADDLIDSGVTLADHRAPLPLSSEKLMLSKEAMEELDGAAALGGHIWVQVRRMFLAQALHDLRALSTPALPPTEGLHEVAQRPVKVLRDNWMARMPEEIQCALDAVEAALSTRET